MWHYHHFGTRFYWFGLSGDIKFPSGKHENALQKAVDAMNNQASIQHNKLIKLDNTMLMYGIYNAETLEN